MYMLSAMTHVLTDRNGCFCLVAIVGDKYAAEIEKNGYINCNVLRARVVSSIYMCT